eukprot:gene13727-15158_t
MFIERPKEEIYDVVASERVVILVALDVDALCACKVLQLLFQKDHVQYTIVPINGYESLKASFEEHKEQVKHFVLINCGGTVNLIEDLAPDDDVTFFIADSHRPLDLDNVYNQDQVKIMIKEGDTFDEIPEFEKVYESEGDESDEDNDNADDNDAENSDEENSLEPSSKRQKTNESKFKKLYQYFPRVHIDKLLFEYYEYTFHGTAAAVIMYDFAWKMSKDSNDLLWETYISEASNLQDHVLRLNVNDDEGSYSVNCLRLSYEDELPIVQCKQNFTSMDVNLRNDVKELIDKHSKKFGIGDINCASFIAQYGFKNKYCAADIVHAVSATLENQGEKRQYSDNFLEALDVLSRNNTEQLKMAIDLAKQKTEALVNQVRSFIDMHQIVCAGPFLYAHVQEGTPNAHEFARPIIIQKLARFTLNAYSVMAKSKKANSLPFILAVPLDSEAGTCLLTGVPPIGEDYTKNFFGTAFEQAAKKTKARTNQDYFDPTAGNQIGLMARTIQPADTSKPPAIGKTKTVPNKKPDLSAILSAGLSACKLYLHPKNPNLL